MVGDGIDGRTASGGRLMAETSGSLTMRAESKQYFAAVGANLTRARKAKGYTQAELAQRIGVSQQAVFAYELGERRVSLFILNKLSNVLGVRIEELAGARPLRASRSSKRRLSPRAQRHAERLQALSKTQQRFVIRIIDNLEEHNTSGRR